jgi:hypothetical protein
VYTRTLEPARTLAAETLTLERSLSDLVNQAYGLTPRHPAARSLICPGAGANLCRISAVGGSLEANWT